ncbi:MAG: phosphoribosylaminoimidazolesuccinocarboxamide synthase [Coriobacteriia bacterium]|nr:phosphoribosylaminoimidazolesuccinocarboxamide synthase [Coriobacteriia bacterium]
MSSIPDNFKSLYSGKTKEVLADTQTGDTYLLYKDSATGNDGVFDPGSNTVGGSVDGKGKIGLVISAYFFELLEQHGILTHFLGADLDRELMKVRQIDVVPLEFILRYYTAGSICRRFDLEPGIPFDPPYTEVTLKSDEQGDPLIDERLCIMKGYLQPGEYDQALDTLSRIAAVLRSKLAAMDLILIDLKIELGFDQDRNIVLVDEVTPDIWRVQDSNGNIPNQIDCANLILERIEQAV